MPSNAPIKDLSTELIGLVSALEEFKSGGFYIFDVEDLINKGKFNGFPLVGVSYEGLEPKDQSLQKGPKSCPPSAALLTISFSIVIAINYDAVGEEDTKPIATDLLDSVRSSVLGYSGINSRPWRLSGESPSSGDIEGVIFYGQLWQTDVIMTSNT